MIVLPAATPAQQVRLNRLIHRRLDEDLQQLADQGGWDPAYHAQLFPPWVSLQHRDRCERTIMELKMMAQDKFAHELPQLHQYCLYHALEMWIGSARASLARADEEHRKSWENDVRALDQLIDVAFERTDFLFVERIAESVLRRTEYVIEMGIDPSEFLDLMPDDVRMLVEAALRAPGDATTGPRSS